MTDLGGGIAGLRGGVTGLGGGTAGLMGGFRPFCFSGSVRLAGGLQVVEISV